MINRGIGRRGILIWIAGIFIVGIVVLFLNNGRVNISGTAVEPTAGAPVDNNPPQQQDQPPAEPTQAPPPEVVVQPTNPPPPEPTQVPPEVVVEPTNPPPPEPTQVPPTAVVVEEPTNTTEPTSAPQQENLSVEGTATLEATQSDPVEVEQTAEATDDGQAVEATAEATVEATIEVTAEATAEVTDEPVVLRIDAQCIIPGGITFTIINDGDDMAEEQGYSLDGNNTGSFQLEAGGEFTVSGGYGEPVLTTGDLTSSLAEPCEQPGTIEGVVWDDKNGDGVRSNDEPGIANVTVNMIGADDEPVEFVTDNDGHYVFADTVPSDYTIRVDTNTVPRSLQATYDLDGGNDSSIAINLESAAFITANFGYRAANNSSITGAVWFDLDASGDRNDGDTVARGASIRLINANGGLVAATTTDENGNYSFEGLAAGQYTLRLDTRTLPAGSLVSASPDDNFDLIAPITLDADQTLTDVDFGLLQLS